MRRQGQYADSGVNAYVTAQMQHLSGQQTEHNSGHFQGRLEAFTPERDNPYASSKAEGQWRWERDGSKGSNPMASHMYNERQAGDTSRSYYQDHRPDLKLAIEKDGNNDSRSQPRDEDMDVGYEDNSLSQTFEGLEKKFLDDITKLTEEQSDAEDAENARHREKINAINAQYQEQLAALRARHAGRRDEFLRMESNARQHQYQQAMRDHYPNSSMGPSGPRGFSGVAAGVGEAQRTYNTDHFDSYRERARYLGGSRDHEIEPRGAYPGGRIYDTVSHYY